MLLKVESMHLNGVVVIVPEIFQDARGFFMETYKDSVFRELGLPTNFVQDNHSRSVRDVIRGLHFQWDPPMGKLIRVTLGSAFLVCVDIRLHSPTFGEWVGIEASAENRRQVWAPAGFARGLAVLSENVEIQYKCTGEYNKDAESSVVWNDPDIGIQWPIKNPILSQRDASAQKLTEWRKRPEAKNFTY